MSGAALLNPEARFEQCCALRGRRSTDHHLARQAHQVRFSGTIAPSTGRRVRVRGSIDRLPIRSRNAGSGRSGRW
jgi:hypothetical protein